MHSPTRKLQQSVMPRMPSNFARHLLELPRGGGHGAHIGRHARTSKRKMDLGYGMAGYDFRTLIMASELKHGLNYGFILHLYRNKC